MVQGHLGTTTDMLDWMAPLGELGAVTFGSLVAQMPEVLGRINPNRYEFYAVPLVLAFGIYMAWQVREERRSREVKQEADEAGLNEPPTLHPVIDPAKCIGCGACVNACPEGKVLGLIKDKAELIEPASCIGHGACKTACPANAISLVFGTATRGVDIPYVSPGFETNVPGIFIAGELGGMGLIANAIEQGRQALESISRQDGVGDARRLPLDVVIVGAGPAGISAGLAAREKRLRAVTLEQEEFGGTVAHYPRHKIVMTRPATLPLYGRVNKRKVRKEWLLHLWADVVGRYPTPIRYAERVESVVPHEGGFAVQTSQGYYLTQTVLLATGRRGSPRKLGIPGESLPNVVYKLVDATQYRGSRVLVVGGGDSALESAVALAREGAAVTLSYRGAGFTRGKPANRKALEAAVARGYVQLALESTVAAIHPDCVDLDWSGQPLRIPNDAVIVCAGGVLPGTFLKSLGIAVETKYGTA